MNGKYYVPRSFRYNPYLAYDAYLENNSQQNTMTLKEKFALLTKSEPEKSFFKAGITDRNDNLTSEGQDIFLTWLLAKYGDEFKKEIVDELLKEEDK